MLQHRLDMDRFLFTLFRKKEESIDTDINNGAKRNILLK
jgi:hypothetical protein